MKIAFINIYQDKVFRGAETFIQELSKRLSKGYSVDIISDINYFDILKNRYDVIVPTNGRLQVFLVRFVSWLSGAKMVVSGQSGAGLDDRINLYSLPDVFVALTEHQKSWARKINPFIRVTKIPNGTNLPTLQGSPLRGQTILSVGAFTNEKRHELTIRAVSKMSKSVKLTIVGGGGSKRKEIHDLGIKILGRDRFEIQTVPYEKMNQVYKKGSVLAFPSVPWESFGIVMVEAMASGLAVVACNDPIRQEIVGNAGILVDPTNTDEYAKALKAALDKDWGNVPRKQAEKFSWDKIAKQYEELFKNITKKR